MHMKAQPPVFVPREFRAEMEQLSKAALMDMVWDYAQQIVGAADQGDPDHATMGEIRSRREIILTHREQAKAA